LTKCDKRGWRSVLNQNRVTSFKDDPQTTPTHAAYVKADAEQNFKTHYTLSVILYSVYIFPVQLTV